MQAGNGAKATGKVKRTPIPVDIAGLCSRPPSLIILHLFIGIVIITLRIVVIVQPLYYNI